MRIVVALGGNALLKRGQKPDNDVQEANVAVSVRALAPLAHDHELVVTHGNGPQVGVLALESALDPNLTRSYPFDVLGAQTQGMIGYWLLQALQNELPGHQIAAIINQTLVSAADPAFADPTKFIGEIYDEARAHSLANGARLDRQTRRPALATSRRLARAATGGRDPLDPLDARQWCGRGLCRRRRGAGGAQQAWSPRGCRGRRRQGPHRSASLPRRSTPMPC